MTLNPYNQIHTIYLIKSVDVGAEALNIRMASSRQIVHYNGIRLICGLRYTLIIDD
ncbi:hypothetical protein RIVM261_020580 [Rivularia sp. IAM M-261]|nr:hypothetical protein CAL7716_026610 [Calothrix sp. PCC 7716]GJD17102.1 hypothetical protein RIVM261_020580 [Rivularia sp. IAM M-261]